MPAKNVAIFPETVPPSVISPPSAEGLKVTQDIPVQKSAKYYGTFDSVETVTLQRLPPAFTFGKSQVGDWRPIAQETELQVGDVARFTYRLRVPYFQEWQINKFLEDMLKQRRVKLLYFAHSPEEGRFWIEAQLLQPSSPALLIGIFILGIGVGWMALGALESIESLGKFKVPGTETEINFIPFLILVGLYIAYIGMTNNG